MGHPTFSGHSVRATRPVSLLSFSGSPLFLNAFDTVGAFLGANDLNLEPKKSGPSL
jgi:hypothetical protein